MATSAFLHSANQPPPLEGYDVFSENPPLVEALRREGGSGEEEQCAAFGRLCGGRALDLGRLANEHPPVLRTHDRFGERLDEVEFHPAWHELLALGVGHGLHSAAGGHVARAARFMTLAYAEAGVGCPLSMTFASVPALRAAAPGHLKEGRHLYWRDDTHWNAEGIRIAAEELSRFWTRMPHSDR